MIRIPREMGGGTCMDGILHKRRRRMYRALKRLEANPVGKEKEIETLRWKTFYYREQ